MIEISSKARALTRAALRDAEAYTGLSEGESSRSRTGARLAPAPVMDKYRSHQRDEESPAINGPDYVALVIEWEEPVQPVENAAGSGASAAPRSSSTDLSDDNPIWSRVDEASAESFPASDPPAWGSSHAVASAGVPEDIPEEVTMPFASRSRGSSTHRLALGIAAVAALLTMIRGLRRIRRYA